jgi:hypothetical protein
MIPPYRAGRRRGTTPEPGTGAPTGSSTLAVGSSRSGTANCGILWGFAFREIGENFLEGFFPAFSRPIDEGDLIQCADLRGVVRTIELRFTHIRSADGRDIFISSSRIFKSPQRVASRPLSRASDSGDASDRHCLLRHSAGKGVFNRWRPGRRQSAAGSCGLRRWAEVRNLAFLRVFPYRFSRP